MSKRTRPWTRRQRKAIRRRTRKRGDQKAALLAFLRRGVARGMFTKVEHPDGSATYNMGIKPSDWYERTVTPIRIQFL